MLYRFLFVCIMVSLAVAVYPISLLEPIGVGGTASTDQQVFLLVILR